MRCNFLRVLQPRTAGYIQIIQDVDCHGLIAWFQPMLTALCSKYLLDFLNIELSTFFFFATRSYCTYIFPPLKLLFLYVYLSKFYPCSGPRCMPKSPSHKTPTKEVIFSVFCIFLVHTMYLLNLIVLITI